MEYRNLGNSGLKVSVLSFGSWVTFGNEVNVDSATEMMQVAFDAGINFFDNAEVYASGEAETVMGKALKNLQWDRSEYVLSTKIFWGGKTINQKGLSRKHLVEGLNKSLKRLQLDYVDLLYCHRPDPETPMEEIVRAMNFLIDQGKTFYWGTSEWSAYEIQEALTIANRLGLVAPLMEQPQYNMLHRERFEVEYAPLYKSMKLGTTIWSPLAMGLLTGKYNDGKIPDDSRLATHSELSGGSVAKLKSEGMLERLRALADVAKSIDTTFALLSIAWCVKNPNVSSVILGASRKSQLVENVKALEVVPKLTDEVMEKIEKILGNKPKGPINFRSW